jgi:hypothetical protein
LGLFTQSFILGSEQEPLMPWHELGKQLYVENVIAKFFLTLLQNSVGLITVK